MVDWCSVACMNDSDAGVAVHEVMTIWCLNWNKEEIFKLCTFETRFRIASLSLGLFCVVCYCCTKMVQQFLLAMQRLWPMQWPVFLPSQLSWLRVSDLVESVWLKTGSVSQDQSWPWPSKPLTWPWPGLDPWSWTLTRRGLLVDSFDCHWPSVDPVDQALC